VNLAATPTILEAVNEEPSAVGRETKAGGSSFESTIDDGAGASAGAGEGVGVGVGTAAGVGSATTPSQQPLTAAERRAAARQAARERARKRAMERTSKRRGDRSAPTVGSFWRTTAGQTMAATMRGGGGGGGGGGGEGKRGEEVGDANVFGQEEGAGVGMGMDMAMERSLKYAAESEGEESKGFDGAQDSMGHSDLASSSSASAGGYQHHAAGAGVAAVRRLSSRNLTAGSSGMRGGEGPEDADAAGGGGGGGSARGSVGGMAFASARSLRTTLDRQPFQVLPRPLAAFGELQAGRIYRFPVRLRNTTVDAARFRIAVGYITHEAAGNSLRLVTVQGGKVAAGMSATVEVELYARVLGSVATEVELATEAGPLIIPVTARVQRAPVATLARGVQEVSRRAAERDDAAAAASGAYVQSQRPQLTMGTTMDSLGVDMGRGGGAGTGTTGGSRSFGQHTSGGMTAAQQYLAPVPPSDQVNQTLDDAEAEERMLQLLRAE